MNQRHFLSLDVDHYVTDDTRLDLFLGKVSAFYYDMMFKEDSAHINSGCHKYIDLFCKCKQLHYFWTIKLCRLGGVQRVFVVQITCRLLILFLLTSAEREHSILFCHTYLVPLNTELWIADIVGYSKHFRLITLNKPWDVDILYLEYIISNNTIAVVLFRNGLSYTYAKIKFDSVYLILNWYTVQTKGNTTLEKKITVHIEIG